MTPAEINKYQFWKAVLKEVTKEYPSDSNISKIINNLETRLKEATRYV